jgi:hypothetical protein
VYPGFPNLAPISSPRPPRLLPHPHPHLLHVLGLFVTVFEVLSFGIRSIDSTIYGFQTTASLVVLLCLDTSIIEVNEAEEQWQLPTTRKYSIITWVK